MLPQRHRYGLHQILKKVEIVASVRIYSGIHHGKADGM
jgi:hypothetical protein